MATDTALQAEITHYEDALIYDPDGMLGRLEFHPVLIDFPAYDKRIEEALELSKAGPVFDAELEVKRAASVALSHKLDRELTQQAGPTQMNECWLTGDLGLVHIAYWRDANQHWRAQIEDNVVEAETMGDAIAEAVRQWAGRAQ